MDRRAFGRAVATLLGGFGLSRIQTEVDKLPDAKKKQIKDPTYYIRECGFDRCTLCYPSTSTPT